MKYISVTKEYRFEIADDKYDEIFKSIGYPSDSMCALEEGTEEFNKVVDGLHEHSEKVTLESIYMDDGSDTIY
jgi:hypothetical protein